MLLNQNTNKTVEAFCNRPTSSVLIIGGKEHGSDEVIDNITKRLLKGENRHNLYRVSPQEKNSISIDDIRELKNNLKTKVTGKKEVARIAIVECFETASRESQNALLKLLEEPVYKTVLVIQTTDDQRLLSTIRSRCQRIVLLPINEQQANEFGNENGFDKSAVKKAYLLSDGKAKLFQDVLQDSPSFQTKIDDAKAFIGTSSLIRLSMYKKYEKKEQFEELFSGLEIISSAALHSPQTLHIRWKKIVTELKVCRSLQQKNVLQKLLFMRICVSL